MDCTHGYDSKYLISASSSSGLSTSDGGGTGLTMVGESTVGSEFKLESGVPACLSFGAHALGTSMNILLNHLDPDAGGVELELVVIKTCIPPGGLEPG